MRLWIFSLLLHFLVSNVICDQVTRRCYAAVQSGTTGVTWVLSQSTSLPATVSNLSANDRTKPLELHDCGFSIQSKCCLSVVLRFS